LYQHTAQGLIKVPAVLQPLVERPAVDDGKSIGLDHEGNSNRGQGLFLRDRIACSLQALSRRLLFSWSKKRPSPSSSKQKEATRRGRKSLLGLLGLWP
jgi:hypothetical protein